ncbi:MAG: cob(I)yrinic acid a,c-diamide adenosyltransferase [Armatimonadota bacterium]|nr:cob(I)yrinic acid a,c-diamide adenosyltransferase [Armatimonadota bacterium]MDR7437444.1 cob(I)yrinic acid a,c-diamide adenosyltransferase [Armatimonadota bacterium]MDR7473195.1 cob(I)yrinic acid a,c-diamide adenosyltransferase [Armatimonadota bacterium]MDR7506953.1 cob(I)yrinic acid a,c-diamide adenosyltransferase [Armatimonadota bacterium]MDR7509358.1 cob(I)yrinic acid a,c-diamide adenosyltransferase [Armatimonadota bacterium]
MTRTPRRAAGPRIYTRAGDAGETGLIGGRRVPKDHPRVEAYGAVDELNAHLGAVRALARAREVTALLGEIQHRLFDLGAELATPPTHIPPAGVRAEDVAALERAIDRYQDRLAPLRAFVLPGGTPLAASLHVARAVCRRAERRVVALARAEPVRPEVLQYLNRLSDLLFVLAREANRAARRADVLWQRRA